MRRYIVDFVRRQARTYVVVAILIAAVWLAALGGDADRPSMRVALYASLLVELVLMLNVFAPPLFPGSAPDFYVLPLSRRQRGTAIWCLVVAVPVIVSAAAKLLLAAALVSAGIGRRGHAGWLAFTIVFDAAYVGTLGAVGTGMLESARGIPRPVRLAAWPALILGGWYAFGRILPVSWPEVGAGTWALLMVGLALGIVSYLRSSRFAVYVDARTASAGRVGPAPVPFPPRQGWRPREPFTGRWRGVRRLLLQQFGIGAAIAAVLYGTVALADRVFAGFAESGNPLSPSAFTSGGALPLLIACSVVSRSLWFSLRAWRTLPLAAWELNAIELAQVSSLAAGLVCAIAAMDAVFYRSLPALADLEGFAALWGVLCVANAANMRWQRSENMWSSLLLIGVAVPLFLKMNAWHLSGVAVGLICVAGAACWNHYWLSRSTAVYRRSIASTRRA